MMRLEEIPTIIREVTESFRENLQTVKSITQRELLKNRFHIYMSGNPFFD